MKTNFTKLALNLCGAIVCAMLLQAAESAKLIFGSRPGCKVTIDGTSTIHDWTVEGQIIGGLFEVDPAFATDKSLKSVATLTTKEKAPKVEVFIPVRSLKSKFQKMDEIMQEAMRMTNAPRILYRATEMVAKAPVPDAGSPVKFDTKGELAVAGVTNKIDMEVTMERMDNDMLKFTGSKALKMTDFKITPPSPKLSGGFIKTGDEVTVKFEWVLGMKK